MNKQTEREVTGAKTVSHVEPVLIRFLRRFIEGNYFYVISVCLMMLGSFLLMRSPLVKGTVFTRTLKTLLILQGYEILVIITAIVIVQRFKYLSDAFTLLVIELALLLDPTFFSNSFFTMLQAKSTSVNFVCFLLVPIKLYILQRTLRLRLSHSMFAAFLFAGVLVYLAEGPLNLRYPPLSLVGYYYLLGWMPVMLGIFLPSMNRMVTVESENPEYITERQRAWLPRFLLLIPMVIVIAHFIESSQVYGIRFYWLYGAPLLLALGVLIIKNTQRQNAEKIITLIDIISVIALVISIGPLNIMGKAALLSAARTPASFIRANIPLMLCGFGVAALYLYFYMRLGYSPAVRRIGILAAIGGAYLLIKIGVVGRGFELAAEGINELLNWIKMHPSVALVIAWLAILAIAYQFQKFHTWLLLGIYTIFLIFYKLPVKHDNWIPEVIQCGFILLILLYHRFGYPYKERYTAAFMVAAIGLGRFCFTPAGWTAGIVAVEASALMAVGVKLSQRGYFNIGVLQAIGFLAFAVIKLPIIVHPALAALSGGIIIFAIGVAITFHKKAILEWLGRWAADYKTLRLQERKAEEVLVKEPAPAEAPPPSDVPSEAEVPEIALEEGVPLKTEELAKVGQMLEALFITEPERGIFLAKDLGPNMLMDINLQVDWKPNEELIVCFITGKKKPKNWKVLLTNYRLIFKQQMGKALYSVYYPQIASVSRHFASVIITGHAGQVLGCYGLSVTQARYLKKGIETLLAEIAIEPPRNRNKKPESF